MSSADLIQVMPGYGVEPGCCIFSRGDLQQERGSSLSHGIVVFDRVLRFSGATQSLPTVRCSSTTYSAFGSMAALDSDILAPYIAPSTLSWSFNILFNLRN